MADGPSNFVSWQDQLDLTGDQEQQLLDKAMAEATNTNAQAGHALEQSADEAGRAQMNQTAAGGVATATLSGTGSYRDYLNLKTKAAEQYQAALRGGNSVGSMVRRQRAQQSGVNDAWTQQGDALEARQHSLEAASTEGAAAQNRLAADQKGRSDAKAAADKARADEGAVATNNFNNAVLAKMRGQWSEQDKRHGAGTFSPFRSSANGFGGEYNPFGFQRGRVNGAGPMTGPNPDEANAMGAGAYYGLEDNQRLAQIARNQGMTSEADKYQSAATYDANGKRIKGGL